MISSLGENISFVIFTVYLIEKSLYFIGKLVVGVQIVSFRVTCGIRPRCGIGPDRVVSLTFKFVLFQKTTVLCRDNTAFICQVKRKMGWPARWRKEFSKT